MGLSQPSLAVKIGRIEMKNPVMTASGTFGYGGEMAQFVDINRLGAIVVKGVSLEPWQGNPCPRTVETSSGMLNAIGLQNDGVDSFISERLPFLRQFETPVIVNVVGHTVEEYAEVAARLDKAEGVAGIEINISCPNVEQCMMFGATPKSTSEVVSAVRKQTSLTLITKLSPNTGDIVSIAKAAVEAGSDALSLINTLLGTAIDPWTRSFKLANVTGGLSGPAIKPVALRMVYEVAQASLKVPIVGIGGIVTGLDAVEFLLAGATAVAVGTATFVNPLAAIEIIDGIDEYLTAMGIRDVNEIVGAVRGQG